MRCVRAARAGQSDTAAADLLRARPIVVVPRDAAANRAARRRRGGEVRDGSLVAHKSNRESRRTVRPAAPDSRNDAVAVTTAT